MKTPIILTFLFVTVALIAQSQSGFAVEIGAFDKKVALSYFDKMPKEVKVYEVVDLNDIYRYWIDAKDREKAEELRQEAIQQGFVNARVIDLKALKRHCEALCGYTPPKATNRFREGINTTSKTITEEDSYKIPTNEDLEKEDVLKTNPKFKKEDLNKPAFFDLTKDKMSCLFYDYKSPYLRAESKMELDKAASVLLQKPQYKIKIYSHTDANGSDEYNYKLSETRAEIVHKYLIWRGVGASRITDGPYGERRPIAKNKLEDGTDSSEGRQLNRRVEFVIFDENGNETNLVKPIIVPDYLKLK